MNRHARLDTIPDGADATLPGAPMQGHLKVTLIYVLLSSLWIFISDNLAFKLFTNPDTLLLLQNVKGIFFIILSGSTIFLLTRRLERKLARRNEQLAESLTLQRNMTQEIHHRVNNNLQMLCSLIHLNCHNSTSAETQDVLNSLESKISAISKVHHTLIHDGSTREIELCKYMRDLKDQLFRIVSQKDAITLETCSEVRVQTTASYAAFALCEDAAPNQGAAICHVTKATTSGPNKFATGSKAA